jgi:hypothetical protein
MVLSLQVPPVNLQHMQLDEESDESVRQLGNAPSGHAGLHRAVLAVAEKLRTKVESASSAAGGKSEKKERLS